MAKKGDVVTLSDNIYQYDGNKWVLTGKKHTQQQPFQRQTNTEFGSQQISSPMTSQDTADTRGSGGDIPSAPPAGGGPGEGDGGTTRGPLGTNPPPGGLADKRKRQQRNRRAKRGPSKKSPKSPTSNKSPEGQLALVYNILLRHMTPEDRQTFASRIFIMDPDTFPQYGPNFDPTNIAAMPIAGVGEVPSDPLAPTSPPGTIPGVDLFDVGQIPHDVTSRERDIYTSAGRGTNILKDLNTFVANNQQMLQNNQGLKHGLSFLQTVSDAVQDFGGQGPESRMTQRQEQQLRARLQPILDAGENTEFAEAARAIAFPFMSAGDTFNEEDNQRFG